MTKREFAEAFECAVREITPWAQFNWNTVDCGPLAGSIQIHVIHRGKSAFYGRSLASLNNDAQTQFALTVQARICAEAVA
jgi:hypothetical protein